jgi:hypothetical protein
VRAFLLFGASSLPATVYANALQKVVLVIDPLIDGAISALA